MSAKRFAKALESMRDADPRVREDGFDFLREHADAYVGELIAAFTEAFTEARSAAGEGELRCWLLELIAEARSPRALPVLAGQLDGDDEALRFWAIRGLEMLDSQEAQRELSRAEAAGWLS